MKETNLNYIYLKLEVCFERSSLFIYHYSLKKISQDNTVHPNVYI